MTIVVNVEELPLEQVTKQLNKLVNVIKIVELDPGSSVQRELLLVKVRADLETRSQVLETVQLFRAKVVDVAPDAVTIEATGNVDKLEALLQVLEPFGIRELVQSGMVAIGRGPRSITDRSLRTARARRLAAPVRPADVLDFHRPSVPTPTPEGDLPVAEMFYDDDADLSDHPGPQGRGHRLRQPGPRPRAVAARLRRRRPRRSARGLEEPGQGRGRGPARRHAGRGRAPRPTSS